MTDFKRLLVWQKAHVLALRAHRAASCIRGAQNAALRSQLTRAAQSIPANIVEGCSQRSAKEFARFLGYAIHSASELEYHIIVARDTHALPAGECAAMMDQLIEVRRMLYGLLSYVSRKAES
jgi:four helix bundle protein